MQESIEANWKRIEALQNQLKSHNSEQEKAVEEILQLQNETKEMMSKVFESNRQMEFLLRQSALS